MYPTKRDKKNMGDNSLFASQTIALEEIGIKLDTDLSVFEKNRSEYHKIDMDPSGRMDSIIQLFPTLMANSSNNSDVYRVIYDKGLGELQKVADQSGLFRGNVVARGSNNSIVEVAKLEQLSMAPQLASSIFSVMSIVTGQYYLSQITTNLKLIDEELKSVQKFLQDDKRSQLESSEEYLKGLQSNYYSLLANNLLRQSSLTTIQRIKLDANSNIILAKKHINDLKGLNAKQDKAADIQNNIQNMNYYISEYWYSLYIYCYASCMEIAISQNADKKYIENIKDDISKKCYGYKKDYDLWNKTLIGYIEEAHAFQDNELIKALEKSPLLIGSLPVAGVAHLADYLDTKKKSHQKAQATAELAQNYPQENWTPLEMKMNEVSLLDSLYGDRLELVVDHGELYIRNESRELTEA